MALTLRINEEQQAILERIQERFGYTTASGFFISMIEKYEELYDEHGQLKRKHAEQNQKLYRLQETIKLKLQADSALARVLQE